MFLSKIYHQSAILLSVLIVFTTTVSCSENASGENAESNVTENMVPGPSKRMESPGIVKITAYKISKDDTVGRVIEEKFYQGNKVVKDVDYDFFTEGKVFETTEYQYNDAGKVVSEVTILGDGSKETITFTYSSAGHLVEGKTVGGENEGIYAYTYDDKGNLLNVNVSDLNGKVRLERRMEYKYDDKGNVLEQKEFVKKEGSTEEEMNDYIRMTYDEKGNILSKELLNKDGKLIEKSDLKYDEHNRLISESDVEGNEKKGEEHTEYNNYGEIVKITENEGGVTNTLTYEYDQYGNKIRSWFQDNAGDAYGERFEIEYSK